MARNTVLNHLHKVDLLKGREATLIEALTECFTDELFMQLCDVQMELVEAEARNN